MAATPVVENFDVIEQISDRFVSRGVARTVHPFFRLLKKLSVGALSSHAQRKHPVRRILTSSSGDNRNRFS